MRTLFELFRLYLLEQTRRCLEQSIRINVIGRRDRLSRELCQLIERSERATAQCRAMHLRIAVDYSARYSLIEAGRRMRPEDGVDREQFMLRLAETDHSLAPAGDVDLLRSLPTSSAELCSDDTKPTIRGRTRWIRRPDERFCLATRFSRRAA